MKWLICWWHGHNWGMPEKWYEGSGINDQPVYSWSVRCERCGLEEDISGSKAKTP